MTTKIVRLSDSSYSIKNQSKDNDGNTYPSTSKCSNCGRTYVNDTWIDVNGQFKSICPYCNAKNNIF